MSDEIPSNGDHIELSFEGKFGNQSPVRGIVTGVEENPDVPETTLFIEIEETSGGERHLVYAEGIEDGQRWANVSVINRNMVLGSNASYELW